MSKRPNRTGARLFGVLSFGWLAWWLHPHWTSWLMAVLCALNVLVLLWSLLATEEGQEG